MPDRNDRRNAEAAEERAAELAGSLDLAELRARIDVLDREMIRLLNERAKLGVLAGRAKAAAGKSVGDPERERDVLLRVALANDGPLPQAALLDLYRRLIEAIKALEEADNHPRVEGGWK